MARHDAFIDHLQQVPLFAACSRKDLQLVARRAEDVRVAAGKALVSEGETGHEFFVILDGQAKVTRQGRKVASLGPGDAFGELALLEKAPRNATVIADSDMELVVLSQREIPRDTPIEVLGSVIEEEPETVTTFSTTGAMA